MDRHQIFYYQYNHLKTYLSHHDLFLKLSVLNHLLGHDDKSKEYLEKLDDNLFMNLPNVVSKQFCGSYKRFMTKLLEFKENSKSKVSLTKEQRSELCYRLIGE